VQQIQEAVITQANFELRFAVAVMFSRAVTVGNRKSAAAHLLKKPA
jgi:hypothetical protein